QAPLAEGSCTSCMLCVSHCPTGALCEKTNSKINGPFKTEQKTGILTVRDRKITVTDSRLKDGTMIKINLPIISGFTDKEYIEIIKTIKD
ncbi:MAG TPA: hypothetical protein DC049_15695, partial [Spirochaetia bacterium]|nr:hypothetical protein [Spirochaetia bacterium]